MPKFLHYKQLDSMDCLPAHGGKVLWEKLQFAIFAQPLIPKYTRMRNVFYNSK